MPEFKRVKYTQDSGITAVFLMYRHVLGAATILTS